MAYDDSNEINSTENTLVPKFTPPPRPPISGADRLMQSMMRYEIYQGMRGPRPSPMGRGSYGRGGVYGRQPGQMGEDFSQPIDPDVGNALLSPYGLQMPQHYNPFLMFPDQNGQGDPTFFGRHPMLTRGIEGALMGAQVPQGETIGENIGNVARTVMGIPNAYRENFAAQQMAPFHQAQTLASLQNLGDEHALRQAQIEQMSDKTALGLDRINATRPLPLPNGQVLGYDTNQGWHQMPEFQQPPTTKSEFEQGWDSRWKYINSRRQAKNLAPYEEGSDEWMAARRQYITSVESGVVGREASHNGSGKIDPRFKIKLDTLKTNYTNAQGEFDRFNRMKSRDQRAEARSKGKSVDDYRNGLMQNMDDSKASYDSFQKSNGLTDNGNGAANGGITIDAHGIHLPPPKNR